MAKKKRFKKVVEWRFNDYDIKDSRNLFFVTSCFFAVMGVLNPIIEGIEGWLFITSGLFLFGIIIGVWVMIERKVYWEEF